MVSTYHAMEIKRHFCIRQYKEGGETIYFITDKNGLLMGRVYTMVVSAY